jgi:hypothetical protein
LHFDTQK